MVSLIVVFWMYVILFAVIGGMRGWARELLVSFSVILGLFIISVMENFIPFVRDTLAATPMTLFWLRVAIVIALVFFGYQTPNLPRLAGSNRFVRERLQDTLLGVFLGALNGYLIAGTIWYFLDSAGYPFPSIIQQPTGDILTKTQQMIALMPPKLLMGSPAIYFAVAVAFVFVLVVFI